MIKGVSDSSASGKTIAIAGNIGSGKSSLVEFLTRTYGIQPFYEPNEENPYLPDFYRDMKRWAFHSQLYFLSNKFRMHQQSESTAGVVVLDRTIYEDAEIFATALHKMKKFTGRDWDTYWSFYQIILEAIRPPDLMIYLRCSMRTLRKRIRLRGRQMEADIPLSYLRRLDLLYEQWLNNYRSSETESGEVLVLDTDKLDYINDMVDCLDVMERVEALLPSALNRETSR